MILETKHPQMRPQMRVSADGVFIVYEFQECQGPQCYKAARRQVPDEVQLLYNNVQPINLDHVMPQETWEVVET